MTGAGNLVVHLMAQTQHFEQGMRRGVSHSNRMRDSVGKLSGGMKMLAGAFGVSLGAGGFIMGLKKSMSLAQEQIKQEQKLEAVLRATGHAAGFSATELKQHAASLQQVTNFGDEATIGAQAVLATFKKIRGDVFKDATVVIQDMASVLGTDLQSAAIQVGKALNDPTAGITALTRVGVTFNAQQKEQIKTMHQAGDILGAQKVILAELESQFGGAAEAMADPVVQLKNSIGDLGESIGYQVLPFARMLAEDLAQPTSDAAEAAKQSASEFGGMAGAIFMAADAAQALTIGFKEAQLASTKLFLWNEETGKSWWGWLGEDVEAEAYIDELQRRVKELEKGLKSTTDADWAGDMQRRYRVIQDALQNPGGPASRATGVTEPSGFPPEWYEGLDFLSRMQEQPPIEIFAKGDLEYLQQVFDDVGKEFEEKTKLDEMGERLRSELETPLEAYQRRIDELGRMLDVGSIDNATYQRALEQMGVEIGGDTPELGPTRFAGAMGRDTREAYSAVLAAQSGRDDPSKKVAENTKDMKEQLKQIKDGIARQVALMEVLEMVEIPAA